MEHSVAIRTDSDEIITRGPLGPLERVQRPLVVCFCDTFPLGTETVFEVDSAGATYIAISDFDELCQPRGTFAAKM